MNSELGRAAVGFGSSSLANRQALLVGGGATALGLAMPRAVSAQGSGPVKRPRFAKQVGDSKFTVPAGKEAGNISAVAVSPVAQDVFFRQTPFQTTDDGAEERRLPFVVRTDKNGKFITAFGGPSFGPTIDGDNQWMGAPDNLESCARCVRGIALKTFLRVS